MVEHRSPNLLYNIVKRWQFNKVKYDLSMVIMLNKYKMLLLSIWRWRRTSIVGLTCIVTTTQWKRCHTSATSAGLTNNSFLKWRTAASLHTVARSAASVKLLAWNRILEKPTRNLLAKKNNYNNIFWSVCDRQELYDLTLSYGLYGIYVSAFDIGLTLNN